MLSGLLLEHFWWGSIFLINVPIVIVALVAGFFLVPESRNPKRTPLDLPGTAFSVGMLTTLLYGIIEAPRRGWADPLVLGGFAAMILLGAAFVWWELHTDHPMLDLRLFRNPRFSAGSGAIALVFMSLFGMMFLLTQYLQAVRGYSPFYTGLQLTPLAFGMMTGAISSHRLVRRLGTQVVVAAGLLLVVSALVGIAQLGSSTPAWIIGVGLFVTALGLGSTMAPSTDAIMAAVPEANAGVGSAVNDTMRQVGGALGVAVLGSVLNAGYSPRMAEVVAHLPAAAAKVAQDSVGGALQAAAHIGGPVADMLRSKAQGAFLDSFSPAVLTAAAGALVAAIFVARFMPARDLPFVVIQDDSTPARDNMSIVHSLRASENENPTE